MNKHYFSSIWAYLWFDNFTVTAAVCKNLTWVILLRRDIRIFSYGFPLIRQKSKSPSNSFTHSTDMSIISAGFCYYSSYYIWFYISNETVKNTDNWNISCNAVGMKWSKQGYWQAAIVSISTNIQQKCLHKTNSSYTFHFFIDNCNNCRVSLKNKKSSNSREWPRGIFSDSEAIS